MLRSLLIAAPRTTSMRTKPTPVSYSPLGHLQPAGVGLLLGGHGAGFTVGGCGRGGGTGLVVTDAGNRGAGAA
jgi:hypothetical protein